VSRGAGREEHLGTRVTWVSRSRMQTEGEVASEASCNPEYTKYICGIDGMQRFRRGGSTVATGGSLIAGETV